MDPLHGVTLSSDHATIRVPWIQLPRWGAWIHHGVPWHVPV